MSARGFLGEFEQVVLLAVLRLRDQAYGIPIRLEIAERTARDVTIGALYATLDRLESKGLVESRVSGPTPRPGGRSRRYFRVTALGSAALERTKSMMDRMWKGVRLDRVQKAGQPA